jgi:hypothetical protein
MVKPGKTREYERVGHPPDSDAASTTGPDPGTHARPTTRATTTRPGESLTVTDNEKLQPISRRLLRGFLDQ